jgi:hypothetical protein
MLPLASGSGYAIIGGVVTASALLIWVLLRSEVRNEQADQPTEDARSDADSNGVGLP